MLEYYVDSQSKLGQLRETPAGEQVACFAG